MSWKSAHVPVVTLFLSFVFCELFLFCDNSLGKWFGPNISLKHTFRLQDPKALKLFFFNTLTLSTSQKIHINHPSFLDQYFFLTLQVEAFPDFKTCATCLFKDILTWRIWDTVMLPGGSATIFSIFGSFQLVECHLSHGRSAKRSSRGVGCPKHLWLWQLCRATPQRCPLWSTKRWSTVART